MEMTEAPIIINFEVTFGIFMKKMGESGNLYIYIFGTLSGVRFYQVMLNISLFAPDARCHTVCTFIVETLH